MNKNNTKYNYGKCHVCGERMQEQRINQDFWLKGKLLVVESVPTGVCPRCGEKIVRADVGRDLMTLLQNVGRSAKEKTLAVPVYEFQEKAA